MRHVRGFYLGGSSDVGELEIPAEDRRFAYETLASYDGENQFLASCRDGLRQHGRLTNKQLRAVLGTLREKRAQAAQEGNLRP